MTDSTLPRVKIVLLGDSACGKTSLFARWISNSMSHTSSPTVGPNQSAPKTVTIPKNGDVLATVWDTAGQEKFRALIPSYCRNAHLILLVTSISDAISFDSVPDRVKHITEASETPSPIVLVVNKMDLIDKAVKTAEEIHSQFENESFRSIFFVSALTGENVEALFQFAVQEAAQFAARIIAPQELKVDEAPQKEGSCC
jgi:small GTP-binding protein